MCRGCAERGEIVREGVVVLVQKALNLVRDLTSVVQDDELSLERAGVGPGEGRVAGVGVVQPLIEDFVTHARQAADLVDEVEESGR